MEKILVKRFEITQNRSLDAMDDIVNRRKMTEFGNIALVEDRETDDAVALRLPGVRKGDMASRSFKPEVRVTQVRFAPTGTTFFFPLLSYKNHVIEYSNRPSFCCHNY